MQNSSPVTGLLMELQIFALGFSNMKILRGAGVGVSVSPVMMDLIPVSQFLMRKQLSFGKETDAYSISLHLPLSDKGSLPLSEVVVGPNPNPTEQSERPVRSLLNSERVLKKSCRQLEHSVSQLVTVVNPQEERKEFRDVSTSSLIYSICPKASHAVESLPDSADPSYSGACMSSLIHSLDYSESEAQIHHDFFHRRCIHRPKPRLLSPAWRDSIRRRLHCCSACKPMAFVEVFR